MPARGPARPAAGRRPGHLLLAGHATSACTSATAWSSTRRCRACRSPWCRWTRPARTRPATRSPADRPLTLDRCASPSSPTCTATSPTWPRARDDAELLVVLGDLLDYVDYHDPSAGILGRVFGERRSAVHRAAARRRFPGAARVQPQALGRHRRPGRHAVRGRRGPVPRDARRRRAGHPADARQRRRRAVWNEVAGAQLPYLDGQTGRDRRSPVRVRRRRIDPARAVRSAADVAVAALRPVGRRLSRGGRTPRPGRRALFARPAGISAAALRPDPGAAGDVRAGPAGVHRRAPAARWRCSGTCTSRSPGAPVAGTECVNVGHFQRFPALRSPAELNVRPGQGAPEVAADRHRVVGFFHG